MTHTVQRWGNSLAVRIPRPLARRAGLDERSSVELRLEDRRIVIAPVPAPPKLRDLLAGLPVRLHSRWTPGRGDVVSVLTADQERRPALVLSPAAYSAHTDLAVVCPIAEETQRHPFGVPLQPGRPLEGVVLADRVTSLGVQSSGMRRVYRVPDEVVTAVLATLAVLVTENADP
jgi:mRNA-degrading endonuclease toxin of MazEF toxin-antitoxin module/antitoxin component of MazEF toxin-antitoxin module